MNNYINKIMTNHVFNSESSEDLHYLYSDNDDDDEGDYAQYGGAGSSDSSTDDGNSNNTDGPNGGFPPILILDQKEKEMEKSKNRQLTANKIGVSIKDILSSKK